MLLLLSKEKESNYYVVTSTPSINYYKKNIITLFMKVLISKKKGDIYYYREGDFHCKEGTIKAEEIEKGKGTVKANTNREFLIFDANIYDYSQKLKRGPQLVTTKDLGYIVARTRFDKNSYVVEAGGGSGAATCFFAQYAKRVDTYEIESENIRIIEKNIKMMQIDNVNLLHKDLGEDIEELKGIDLLFLDLPEPVFILKKEKNSVKSGAFIVCYLPSISQIQELTNYTKEREDYYVEEISEVGVRHWKVFGRVSRPNFRREIDHTAFLVFIRKI